MSPRLLLRRRTPRHLSCESCDGHVATRVVRIRRKAFRVCPGCGPEVSAR